MYRKISKWLRVLIVLLACWPAALLAQPCLQGWQYRQAIYLDNTAGPSSTGLQVSWLTDAATAIADGKMRYDYADIRVLSQSGTAQPHYVEQESGGLIRIWARLSTLQAGAKDTLYLFYGKPSATSAASGSLVFDIYDDFNEPSLNSGQWESCLESGASLSLTAGKLLLDSEGAIGSRAQVTSLVSTSVAPLAEMQLSGETGFHEAYLGIIGGGNAGYAMSLRNDGGSTLRMVKVNYAGGCLSLGETAPVQSVSSGAASGVWAFRWTSTGAQHLAWPGNSGINRSDASLAYSDPFRLVLGHQNFHGSVSIDWVRVRQYVANEPAITSGTPLALVQDITASSNSPVCQGATLSLLASGDPSLSYHWYDKANNPVGSGQKVDIQGIGLIDSGQYRLEVTVPSGCNSQTRLTQVQVSQSTQAGVVQGSANLCQGDLLLRSVQLASAIGQVQRWEQSPTGLAPWSVIAHTADSLLYQGLTQDTYYRAVVQNGACLPANAAPAFIEIDQASRAGTVVGTTEACEGLNDGSLYLLDYRGLITTWQSKVADQAAWHDLNESNAELNFSNLDTSTYFRVLVQNGACAQATSDSFRVKIHPLPQPQFAFTPSCLGQSTPFINQTSIPEGSVKAHSWNLGDGNVSNNKGLNYAYSAPGDYTVRLIAESQKGCSDSIKKTVTVYPLPQPAFSFTSGCEEEGIDLLQNANIAQGGITQVWWDFGNGRRQALRPDTTFLPDEVGTHTTKLIAESDQGCLDSVWQTVSLFAKPHVAFAAADVCQGQSIQFTNQSTGEALQYTWTY
ncbi:MAG: DUF2341 domain-containing protein [Cytophagales bacterium]|nr:DUF2341 domain-containing protein [Cytophagales bacterium]